MLRNTVIVALALAAGFVLAAPPASAQVLTPIRDGAGMTWDIQYGGMIADGTGDAFDGGFSLYIDGQQYYGGGQSDGSRATFEPLTLSGVTVSRNEFAVVNPGGLLIVDVLQNPAGTAHTVEVRIESNLGSDSETMLVLAYGARSGAAAGPDTLGVVTDDGQAAGFDPAVVQIFGAPGARVTPTVTQAYDSVTAVFQVEVPPNGRVALATFAAMRPNRDEALSIAQQFQPARVLTSCPDRALAAAVVNWGRGGGLAGPGLPIPREEDRDLVLLASGDRLLGDLVTTTFRFRSRLGEMDLEARRIQGIVRDLDDGLGDGVAIVTGEVYRGRLLTEEIRMRLTSGTEVRIPSRELRSLGRRTAGEGEPEPSNLHGLLLLRTGDSVRAQLAAPAVTLKTVYGPIGIQAGQIAGLDLDWIGRGMERVEFPDGAVVSGILDEMALPFRTGLGDRTVPVDWILRFASEMEPVDRSTSARIAMQNGDALVGSFDVASVRLLTAFGPADVNPRQMRHLDVEAWGAVRAVLWDGAEINGRPDVDVIPFRLDATQTVLRLPLAAIASIDVPNPELPAEIRTRIEALVVTLVGSDTAARAQAAAEIRRIGPAALPFVREVANHPNPEVQAAVTELIRALEQQQ